MLGWWQFRGAEYCTGPQILMRMGPQILMR